ncbi:MAG: adenylate/guanylate cyclase domain-containing protein [Nitrosopumilaceae archaeon]
MDPQDYFVAFSGLSKSYCIGTVDIVNSTRTCAELPTIKVCKYYEIFLNSMSKVLRRFGGFSVKNVGDSLLYFFPESSKPNRKCGFIQCLECSLAMIQVRKDLNKILNEEKLPEVNYRVSADYGIALIMKNDNADSFDLFGPPVNMCCKINILAPSNGIVIGGDLYQVVKHFEDYRFAAAGECPIGLKMSYPVYSVAVKC